MQLFLSPCSLGSWKECIVDDFVVSYIGAVLSWFRSSGKWLNVSLFCSSEVFCTRDGLVFLISIFNLMLSSTLAKLKLEVVEWLNSMLPHINLPLDASDEELRTCLIDGTILCSMLDKLCPGAVQVG